MNTDLADDDARYLALCARDARFDGRFFTGVTSTGIYCRPVCAVRTPQRRHCRFFHDAAQAERAGFRPCLRCRPELAPRDRVWSHQDAGDILVQQAVQWLDDPQTWSGTDAPGVTDVAARLGVSERHLRRLFERRLGVSPLQYLQTRRLLCAKQLLADTALPMAEVALASGFGSLRRFNAAIASHYGLSPSRLRRQAPAGRSATALQLGWRPPLDATALLAFLGERALPGVEAVDVNALCIRRTVRLVAGGQTRLGWVEARFDPARCRVHLQASDALHPALPALIWRVRAWLDLDADPLAIDAVLGADFPGGAGLRVPGCLDGFELAVRAILGQQVTVAGARTFARRLVQRFGEAIDTGQPGLDRLFPSAAALAAAAPDALGALGIVRQRQAALIALARAVHEGRIALDPHADVHATTTALEALPGIGPWTAHYIAMRALRWPDAWPPGDIALHHALGASGTPRAREALAQARARAWQPWRAYAVVRLWAGLHRSTA